MSRIENLQTNFAAGEFHPLLKNRVDLDGYYQALQDTKRVFVLPHGGVSTDGGFAYQGDAKNDTTTRVIPWRFAEEPEQCYALEFGERYIRFFWADDRSVIRVLQPSATYFTGSGLNDLIVKGTLSRAAQYVIKVVLLTEGPEDLYDLYINGQLAYTAQPCSNVATEIDDYGGIGVTIRFGVTAGHTEGDYWEFYVGQPYEIATPYEADEIFELRTQQRADVLYIEQGNHPVRKLIRYGHDDWELKVVEFIEARWLGRTTGMRYKVYDASSNNTYRFPQSPAEFDYKFSEDSGSVLLGTGSHEGRIGWSNQAGYYDEPPAYLRELVPTFLKFAVEYEGPLYIQTPGSYRFAINGGYSVDLYIDGALIVNWIWPIHSPFDPNGAAAQSNYETNSGQIDLSEGEHRIKLRMYKDEEDRRCGAALAWKKPGDSLYTLVPGSQFVQRSESAAVTPSTYTIYDLDGIAVPSSSADMDDACNSETAGVTVRQTGVWDDRINFHSHAEALVLPFVADRPVVDMVDGTTFALQIDGWLYAEESGTYDFALDSNDAADFVLHSGDVATPVASIGWYGAHGCATTGDGYDASGWDAHPSGAVTLTAGWYQFRVRLVNVGYGYGVSIAWKTPSVPATWVPIPRGNITPGREDGYPRLGIFYDGRFWLFRDLTVWASRSGIVEDFTVGADDGDGMEFDLDTQRVDLIQAVSSVKGGLLAFTSGGVCNINSGTSGPITPSDKRMDPEVARGSAFIEPVEIQNSTFYVGIDRRTIYEMRYSRDRNAQVVEDVSQLASHLFTRDIVQIAFQSKARVTSLDVRFDILWVLLDDGHLLAMTYDEANQVYAWHDHSETSANFKSICVIPGDEGDALWVAVRRLLADGRTIEVLDGDRCLDSSIAVTDNAETSLTMFVPHLEETAAMVRYGLRPDVIWGWYAVTMGEVGDLALHFTTAPPYIEVGLPYTWGIRTMPLEKGYPSGTTTRGHNKRWIEAGLEVLETGGTITIQRVNGTMNYPLQSEIATLISGELRTLMLGWDNEASVDIEGDDPMPATILSLRGKMEVE